MELLRRRLPFRDFMFPRQGPERVQWLKTSGEPFFDEAGNFLGYHGIGTDISRQVDAESEAKKSRELLAQAIESLDQTFVLWDADDKLVLCNQRFREINAAFAHAVVPGISFNDHIRSGLEAGAYPDAVGRETDWYRERLRQHRRPTESVEIERQDGRWISLNEQKLPDGGTFSISSDITRLKQAELLKNELVSTVSHELRTPLTALIGALGLFDAAAKGTKIPADVQKLISLARENADRLRQLVDDLLDLDALESGRMEFHFEDVDLNDLLEKSVKINAPYARAFNVELDLLACDVPYTFSGDPDQLLQVLTNLISNACKFSDPKSKVEVYSNVTATGVRVSIMDRGRGISEAFRAQVFERFSRADVTTSRATKGTGLGLAISKSIVERHGGEIGYESEIGLTTTFFFDLPLTPPESASPA